MGKSFIIVSCVKIGTFQEFALPTIDPRLAEFWENEKSLLSEELAGILLPIVLSGASGGFEMLPDAIFQLVDLDKFNQQVIDFLHRYRLALVDGLTTTTRNQVIVLIDDWIRSGEPLRSLQAQLAILPAFSISRAKRVAITEVTRLYAQGNMMAWDATGFVSGKKWQTRRNELVCPLCGPLHGVVVELNTEFVQTPLEIAQSPQMLALVNGDPVRAMRRALTLFRHQEASVEGPPRHINCYCWLLPFLDEIAFAEILREGLGADVDTDSLLAELFERIDYVYSQV